MKRSVWLLAWTTIAACSGGGSDPKRVVDAGHHAADGGAHEDEPDGHEALPTSVRLSDRALADAKVRVAVVVEEALPLTVNLTGEVVADPDRSAKIAARAPGRIAEVRFKEGDRIKAGALLVVLQSSELAKARAALASAEARLHSARQNAARVESLARKGLAAGQEVANTRAETDALEAETRSARQTLAAFGTGVAGSGGDGARLELRAPIGGFVLGRDAIRGQSVTADHVLATIADLDHAFFVARLFEKDLSRVRPGAVAEVRLNAYPDEVFAGKVETIGRSLDPIARTVVARVAVTNREDLLKVGLFGTAHVVVTDTQQRTRRPVVPLSAVTRIADHDVVFVRQADGDFKVHRVTLGRSAAGKVEVVAGLTAGESVVVDGVFSLKSAVLKRTFGEED